MRGADAVIHVAGSYRVGIQASRAAGDVGRERRHDGARARRRDRRGRAPDRLRLDAQRVRQHPGRASSTRPTAATSPRGSCPGTTRPSTARTRPPRRGSRTGAPIVIVMPSQVYGPHDHSLASEQLDDAFARPLRYRAFPRRWASPGPTSTTSPTASSPRSTAARLGERYSLAGECRAIAESVAIAARAGGRRRPAVELPTALLRVRGAAQRRARRPARDARQPARDDLGRATA